MGAAQRARAFERAQQLRLFRRMILFAEHDVVAVEVKSPIERALRRDRRDALTGTRSLREPRADGVAIGVVDADERDFRARDQPLLDRGVMLHRPVAIEMVRRQIDQYADRRRQRRREIDLERRTFDDMDSRIVRRLQRQNRRSDIAAELRVAPRPRQNMGDQRCRRRLAIGAGDRDERRAARERVAFTAEEFDVANHLDVQRLGALDGPMRDGMRQRRAGRQNQRVEPAPVGAIQILDMDFLGERLGAPRLAIVPGRDIGAAGDKRLRGGEPGAAKTKERHAPAVECADRRHRHLNFSVESPMSASTNAMIQKRITICGSFHPFSSK